MIIKPFLETVGLFFIKRRHVVFENRFPLAVTD
jgi:hypothetical protein